MDTSARRRPALCSRPERESRRPRSQLRLMSLGKAIFKAFSMGFDGFLVDFRLFWHPLADCTP